MSSSFSATLYDVFAVCHVMLIDDVEVESVEQCENSARVVLCNDTWLYTAGTANEQLEFVDGKATFTDSDEIVRKVEAFRLVPLTTLDEH